MKRIFIETGSKKSNEYVFVKTLCKQIGIGEYEIQAVGGKDNLSVRIADLEDEGYQNLILFDADKDFEQSKQHIEDQLNGIAARIFLFPNNRDEGRFETLLEQIAVDRTPLVCFKAI